MSSPALILLAGATAGLALAVADRLVRPVVRGWFDDARARDEWALVAPGTLSARLVETLAALALLGGVALAYLLARAG